MTPELDGRGDTHPINPDVVWHMRDGKLVPFVSGDALRAGRIVLDAAEDGSPLLLDLSRDPARVLP